MIKKASFNKEELINLIKMLNSSDKDNAVMALSAIESTEPSIAELILLYAKSSVDVHQENYWLKIAPKSYSKVKHYDVKNKSTSSYSWLIMLLTESAAEDYIIEIVLESFTKSIASFLKDLGYKSINVDININK